MNLLSRNQKGSMRRTREALSVFVVMLFGLVCVGSARAQDVSRYAYVPNAIVISIYTVDCQDWPTAEQRLRVPGIGPRRCDGGPFQKIRLRSRIPRSRVQFHLGF